MSLSTIEKPKQDAKTGMSRRGFLITMAGGLSVGFFLPEAGRIIDPVAAEAAAAEQKINAYVKIGVNGAITLTSSAGTSTVLLPIFAQILFKNPSRLWRAASILS